MKFSELFPPNPARSGRGQQMEESQPAEVSAVSGTAFKDLHDGTGLDSALEGGAWTRQLTSGPHQHVAVLPDQGIDPNIAAADPAIAPAAPMLPPGTPGVVGPFDDAKQSQKKEHRWPAIPALTKSWVIAAPSTTAVAVAIDTDVGFPIRTVQIDNLTSAWVKVAGTERFVPPFTFGTQFPQFARTGKLRITFEAPPGFTQLAANSALFLYIWATEEDHEFSPGIPIPTAQHP